MALMAVKGLKILTYLAYILVADLTTEMQL